MTYFFLALALYFTGLMPLQCVESDIDPVDNFGISVIESSIKNILRKPLIVNFDIEHILSDGVENLGEEILIKNPGTYLIIYYVIPLNNFHIRTVAWINHRKIKNSKAEFKSKHFSAESFVLTTNYTDSTLKLQILGDGISGYLKAFVLIERLN